MNNKFGYTPNLDQLQQYMQKENSKSTEKSNGTRWWSLPSGMSSIRIMPPWDPTGRIALPVYMHPIEYKDEAMQFTKYNWTCLNKTFGKPCKICDGLAELSSVGVDTSNYEANRRQFYFNVLVMHDPSTNDPVAPGTLVVMRAPKTLYDWVIAQITNPRIGDITSLTNGIDVYVTKSGSGLGTTYVPTLSPNGRTPVPQEYLDKIDSLYNLDEIFGAGFDDEQIGRLVDHLRKSAGAISHGVSNTVQQMSGYQQVQMNSIPPQYNVAPTNPNPVGFQPAQYNVAPTNPNPVGFQAPLIESVPEVAAPVAPTYQTPNPTPAVPGSMPMNQTTAAPVQQAITNAPKCFGQYNPSQVNCVICAFEADCTRSSK